MSLWIHSWVQDFLVVADVWLKYCEFYNFAFACEFALSFVRDDKHYKITTKVISDVVSPKILWNCIFLPGIPVGMIYHVKLLRPHEMDGIDDIRSGMEIFLRLNLRWSQLNVSHLQLVVTVFYEAANTRPTLFITATRIFIVCHSRKIDTIVAAAVRRIEYMWRTPTHTKNIPEMMNV